MNSVKGNRAAVTQEVRAGNEKQKKYCFSFLYYSERSGEVQGVDDEVLFPPDDVNTVLTSVKKLLQYDMRRRQATAIVLMGVIGAEFQREIEVYSSRGGEKKMSTTSRRLEKLSETPGKDGKNARNDLGGRKCYSSVNSLLNA